MHEQPLSSSLRPPPPPRPDGTPKAGFFLSLVFCCAPVALVGGVLGLTAVLRARREGRPAPGLAVAAMVLAALSVGLTGWAIAAGVRATHAREARVAEVKQRLAGTLEADALSQATACDLVRAHAWGVDKSLYEEIACPGAFEPGARAARLVGVQLGDRGSSAQLTQTACLLKAHRWFVATTPGDGECEPPLEVLPSTKPSTEEEYQAQETALRAEVTERRAARVVGAFDARVAGVQAALEADDEPGEACPDFPPAAGAPRKVKFADARRLGARLSRGEEWEFLTEGDLRGALDTSRSPSARLGDVEDVRKAGPTVLVFEPEEATWPVVSGSSSYSGGEFHGLVAVVDLPSGKVLCRGPLDFANSEEVSTFRVTKLQSKKGALERAVKSDFEKSFKAAAGAAVKQLTRGQLAPAFGAFD